MTDLERWERLATQISDAIHRDVTVSNRPGGGTYFISLKVGDDRVEVHDKMWRKNHDTWIGYQVHIENSEGILRRSWPITKKRSEVVAAFTNVLVGWL